MALQTATNPETGERVALIGGRWVPFTETATNPKTGERAVFSNGSWLTESQGPAPTELTEPTEEDNRPQAGFLGSFKEAVQTLGLADEAAAYAANPTDENRRAFLKAAESKYKSVGGFGKGDNWEAFKEMLGSSLGFIAAPAAVATGTSVVGTPFAGLAAGAGATMSQYEIQALQRQAEEQERAIAEGRKPQELSLGKATVAAAGETALDVLEFGVFRKLAKAFPFVRNLVSSEEAVAKDAAQKLVQAARDGTLKSTRRGVVEGIAGGVAFEVPQELAQQALERWQAGLSLTDDEAKEEFKQTAIGAAVLGPVLGGPAGALNVRDKRVRAELLKQGTDNALKRLDEIKANPNPTPEEQAEAAFITQNADNPIELAKKYQQPVARKKPVTEEAGTTTEQETAPPPPPEPPAAPTAPEAEPEAPAAPMETDAERDARLTREAFEEYQRQEESKPRGRYDEQTLREAAEAERMAPEDREAPYYPPATYETEARAQEAPAETTGEQRAPDESVPTTTAAGTTETDTGAVGGGAELPAQRARTRKRAVAEPKPARVDDTSVSAPDVVEGEGELQSTLKDADTRVEDWLAKNKKKRAPKDSSLISAALDIVRSTGKMDAVAFQTKLGITMSKARALREALLGSGAVVQKTNVKGAKEAGNYFVVEGQYKPTETVRRVEPTVEETTEKPTPFEREAPLSEGERIRQEMEKAEERRGETPPKPRMEPVKTAKGELADEVRRMFADLEQEEAAKTSAEGQGALDLVGGKAKVERDSAVEKIRKDLIAAGKFLRKEGKMSDSEAARIDRILSKRKPNLEKVRELINKINTREEVSGAEETTKEEVDQLDFDEIGGKYDSELYDYNNLNAYENLSEKFRERPRRAARALNRFKRSKSETTGMPVNRVRDTVESITQSWRNPPNIVVVENYTDLPMEEGVAPESYADTVGMTSGNKVYLVAKNINNDSDLKAALYHESLVHYGLDQLFGDRLTDTLHDIYRTNTSVKAAADAWLAANPDAYSNFSKREREALATEEVFAEKAEAGPMKEAAWRRAFYRLASIVRKFARALSRMVGKELTYSNSEVANILLQAQDKVLTGRSTASSRYNNVRYMRAKYNKVLSNAIDYVQKNAPEPTRDILTGTIRAISRLPDAMRDFKLGILSMHHMTELYEKYIPSVRKMEVLTERMASNATDMLVEFQKRSHEYHKALKANKNLIGEFNEIGNFLNLSQAPLFRWNNTAKKYEIDPASNRMLSIPTNSAQFNALSQKDKDLHDAANRFNALPQEMQDAMIGMSSDYRNYSDIGFDIKFKQILKFLPPTVAQRIRNSFQTNRLQFYLPLRRTGMYRLRYTNANGSPVTEHYSSEAERVLGRRKAEAAGAIPGTFKESGVGESSYEGARAPTGLLKEIMEGVEQALTKANVSKAGIDETTALIFDTFVDYMPGTSGNDLRQEITSRKTFNLNGVTYYGRLGADEDILGVYDRAVPRMIYQLNSLKYTLPLENVRSDIKKEIAEYDNNKTNPKYAGLPDLDTDYTERIRKNLDQRLRFIKNPIYSKYVYALARTNYLFSIAANVSSAIVNTTVIPMITWPTLATKYGLADASLAIEQAMKMYSKHSYTDPVTGKLKFNAEPSFGSGLEARINAATDPAEKAALKEFALFHRALLARSVIGTAAEQELRQAQSLTGKGYDNLNDKVNLVTSYAFRSSERFNREVTALASYMLARNMNPDGSQRTASRGKANIRKAIDDAVRLNTEVNGASLAETNAQFYQTNIGRIILTFRTQPLNMMINLAMTTRNAIRAVEPDPQKRKLLTSLARRKILGIFAATYMMAGIKGLPLFGAAEVLAALMMGDDDEPYDLEQESLDSVGTLGLNGPVNELFNIDMASRTGFYGLFWRDDPKRLAEVGMPIYALERIGGPTVGLLDRARRGFKDLSEGDMVRASEEFTPAPIRNMIKGMRYAVEGATTKKGLPYTQDVSNYNLAMQVLGFAPADVAVAQSQLGAKYEVQGKLEKRRTALIVKYAAAVEAQNEEAMQEALQDILKFDKSNPAIAIKKDDLNRSLKERRKIHAQAVGGMYQTPKMRQATSKYVTDTSKKD